MSSPDLATISHILQNGPHRSEVGRKQLTLALAGQYIASTTPTVKPILVWESEKGYARYYIPTESLHPDIKERVAGSESNQEDEANGHAALTVPITVEVVDTVSGKGNDAKALIEKVSIGSRTTTWVRFVEGGLKGYIRFERNEIGKYSS